MSKSTIDQIRANKAPSVTELVAETRIDAPHPTSVTTDEGADALPVSERIKTPSVSEEDDVRTAIREIEARSVSLQDEAERIVEAARGSDGGIGLETLDYASTLPPFETEEEIDNVSPPDAEAIGRQAGAQAMQLAEHLRARQREIDHREAELNAWAAKLERDARAARLWFDERRAELEEAANEPGTVVLQDDAVRRKAEGLATRERQLDELDAELTAQRESLQKFHEQLTAERQALDEESQAQRERLAAEQARLAAEVQQQRNEVAKRSELVDKSQAALEQFRTELGRMHRETLEIRLATEELWAELSASAPPAALTRSLGRIRSQLADHYRLANAELQEKKEQLERLREQLSEQYEKLVRQKRSFDTWATECREEIDQQAARLQSRSDDLDRREAEMGEYARIAQAEKLDLQQEIRRLRSKLLAQAKAELPA